MPPRFIILSNLIVGQNILSFHCFTNSCFWLILRLLTDIVKIIVPILSFTLTLSPFFGITFILEISINLSSSALLNINCQAVGLTCPQQPRHMLRAMCHEPPHSQPCTPTLKISSKVGKANSLCVCGILQWGHRQRQSDRGSPPNQHYHHWHHIPVLYFFFIWVRK